MLNRVSTQSVRKSSRFGMPSSIMLLSLVAGLVVTNGGLGCGGSLGDECSQNSDCSDDRSLLCIFGRCHNACRDDVDCDNNTMCFRDDTNLQEKKNYCAEPEPCTMTEHCASTDDEAAQNRVCSEGICRKQCIVDKDCPQTQHCVDNVCYKTCRDDQEHDQLCLEGEGCFNGSCAKSDPKEKGDQGNFCQIPTDCKSFNCIEHACEGCRAPVDCGGRECLNMTPSNPSTGICAPGGITGPGESGEAGGASPIQIAESPFDVKEFPTNSTGFSDYTILDSSGLNTYFVVEWFDGDDAKYDIVTDPHDKEPVKICTLPLNAVHGPVSLSHDDGKLYLAGYKLNEGGGVFQIDINSKTLSCGAPVLIPWTAGYYVHAIDVRTVVDENQIKKDILYISGAKLFGGLHAIISGDPDASMHSTWLELDWGAYSIAASEQQIFASSDYDFNGQSNESLFLGVIKPGLMASFFDFNAPTMDADQFNVALNTTEDTLYIAVNDMLDEGHLLAINTSKEPQIVQYKLDGVSNIHRMYRARDKNTFLLTTSVGMVDKLFRIDL